MSLFRFLQSQRAQREPRGQVLVIVAGGLLVMIAMTGLVVDGGFAWGQQRDNQNAADAASEAGAVVLAEAMTGLPRGDAEVSAAVDASAAANGVDLEGAWYTNISGNLVDNSCVEVASTNDAAEVGGGVLPACLNGLLGVQAETSKTFETFLVRVIGFDTLTADADATAVAGYLEEVCADGNDCPVLPVTIPLNTVTCASNGEVVPSNPVEEWPYYNVPLTVPLCKNNPGNVGWLDWTPTAGGTSELITAIGPPTTNKEISVPSWQYITSTGNLNSAGVEDALNYYAGSQTPVLIPMFDSTCNTEPDPPSPGTSDVDRCPPANVGGNGSNQWYHIDRFVSFLMEDPKGAFVNGSNTSDCEENGNGATSCFKGMFTRFVTTGTVGPGSGAVDPNAVVGIQLIK
jgi:Flp pilus assembly protein TadG